MLHCSVAWNLFFVLLSLLSAQYLCYSDKGVLYVDDYTIGRVLDGSHSVFIRFDKEYAWGDDHDAFKELAKKIGETDADILVASLPISKREYEPENMETAQRLGIEEKDWPVFRLYPRGVTLAHSNYATYTGPTTAPAMLSWLAEMTGAFFGLKGQLREMDALAKEFSNAHGDERKEVLARASAELDGLKEKDKESGAYYVKVMTKAIEKPDFVATELARLRKLSAEKGVKEERKAQFMSRINVLTSFVASHAAEKEL